MDRNRSAIKRSISRIKSLSARRAWIEIEARPSVSQTVESLSARRAWIEMIDYIIDYATDASLSARRAWIEILPALTLIASQSGRSPQGERG